MNNVEQESASSIDGLRTNVESSENRRQQELLMDIKNLQESAGFRVGDEVAISTDSQNGDKWHIVSGIKDNNGKIAVESSNHPERHYYPHQLRRLNPIPPLNNVEDNELKEIFSTNFDDLLKEPGRLDRAYHLLKHKYLYCLSEPDFSQRGRLSDDAKWTESYIQRIETFLQESLSNHSKAA